MKGQVHQSENLRRGAGAIRINEGDPFCRSRFFPPCIDSPTFPQIFRQTFHWKEKRASRQEWGQHSRHPALFLGTGAVIYHKDAQPVITRKSGI